jgi:hypothetical protein
MLNLDSLQGFCSNQQLYLLKAILSEPSQSIVCWNEWLKKIKLQSIDPASLKLIPLICKNERLKRQRGPILDKSIALYRKTWVQNQFIYKKSINLIEDLKGKGISKVVFLNDMALLLGHTKDFGAHVVQSIDLLVAKENLEKVFLYLLQNGWKHDFKRFQVSNIEHLKRWNVIEFTHINGLKLRLYWSLLEHGCSLLDDLVIQDSVLEDKNFYLLNPTDLFFEIVVSGASCKSLERIDWIANALIILKTSASLIDWNRLETLARWAKMIFPLKKAIHFLKEHFDVKIPDPFLNSLEINPFTKMEMRAFDAQKKGYYELGAWCRYVLHEQKLQFSDQVKAIFPYIKNRARLKYSWQIPLYLLYLVFEKFYVFVKKAYE